MSASITASRPARWAASLNNSQAIAGLVIKEMYRRKDFYALLIITALITCAMGTVNFFNEANIVRYLKEICLFCIWMSSLVIAISTAARQIPAERESRTLFPLLAKPVSRNDVLLGKFLGCWFACGLCLTVFYCFFAVMTAIREGGMPAASYFQALTLQWFMLGIVVAATLLGSIVFAAPSSNGTIIFVLATTILLLGRHLNKIALRCEEPMQGILYAIYYVIPHLELFDVRDLLVHNWEPIPWVIWLAAITYAAIYATAFLCAACCVFRRKVL